MARLTKSTVVVDFVSRAVREHGVGNERDGLPSPSPNAISAERPSKRLRCSPLRPQSRLYGYTSIRSPILTHWYTE
jgi:hypothetical protein